MSRRILGGSLTLALLLAGCKSSGTAFNPPGGGNIVTLIVSGTPTIAYQSTLHGAWKLLPAGQTQFTVTGGTAYGVAFTCPLDDILDESSNQRTPQQDTWQPTVVIQATTTEANVIPIPCGGEVEPTATLSGNFDATAIEGTEEGYVDANETSTNIDSDSGAYSMSAFPGTQDVFGVAYDDDGDVLALKTYPSVSVSSGTTTQNVMLSSSDAVGSSKSISWTNAPEGSEIESYVSFGDEDAGPNLADSDSASVTYPTIAAADIASDDFYVAESNTYAEGDDSDSDTEAGIFGSTLASTVAYPNVWDVSNPTDAVQPAFTLNYTGFSGLSGGIGAYVFSEEWGTEDEQEGWTFAFVTFGYVHAAGITSYAPPNITLSGFSDMQAESGDIFPYDAAAFYGTPIVLLDDFYFFGLDSAGQRGAQSLHSGVPASWSAPQTSGPGLRLLPSSGLRTLETTTNTTPTSGLFDVTATDSCITIGTGAECEL